MRNKIYRYSLVQSKFSGSIRGFVQPPLTRTNKQIRSESLPIYYGENEFHLQIPYPSPDSRQHWADFIRMFRVFSAGGPEGRGSGSLRFVRRLLCEVMNVFDFGEGYWLLQISFGARGSCDECGYTVSGFGEQCFIRDNEGTAWHHWDSVYDHVDSMLHEQGRPGSTMEHESVHRFISTIVMIASECPDISKRIVTGVEGEPEPDFGDLGW